MIIGINAGHTVKGPGSGASGFLAESIETRRVAKELTKQLANKGHTIINCTVDYSQTTTQNLQSIISLANNKTIDLFISIHFNAGKGVGTEVYTYQGRQFEDAKQVCNNFAKLGFKNRGIKSGTGLYVIRKTIAKSMLVECCFVDTKSDADLYNKLGPAKIAKAIADALPGTYKKPKSKSACVLYSNEADLFYGALALAQKEGGLLCKASDAINIPNLENEFRIMKVGGIGATYAGKDRFATYKKVGEVL